MSGDTLMREHDDDTLPWNIVAIIAVITSVPFSVFVLTL